jgi:phosphoribosyl 1,2-cyclic phosphodiesterase
MSHLHWDHIMGFPFFMPAYIPGTDSASTGATPARSGLSPSARAAVVSRRVLRTGLGHRVRRPRANRDYEIAGLTVRAKLQHHGGDSYGYRIQHGGKVVVYSTDAEHKLDDPRRHPRRSRTFSAGQIS